MKINHLKVTRVLPFLHVSVFPSFNFQTSWRILQDFMYPILKSLKFQFLQPVITALQRSKLWGGSNSIDSYDMAPPYCTERKSRKICHLVQVIFPQNVKSKRQSFEYFFINLGSVATFNESVELVVQNMVQRHHKNT